MIEVAAVIVGAGSGTRFGGLKQFQQLGEKMVFDWSIIAARSVAGFTVAVVPADYDGKLPTGADIVVNGGESRSTSVRCGLAALPESAEIVIVHDAARPFASGETFGAVVEAVRSGADAAVPGIAVPDTLARSEGAEVARFVEREGLVALQTPQAFSASILRAAHEGDPDYSDDSGLVARAGGKVVLVKGDSRAFKITTPDDLVIANALAVSIEKGGSL